MKKLSILLLLISFSSIFALSEMEDLLIKEATTRRSQRKQLKHYLLEMAKEKEESAQRHQNLSVSHSGGKTASQNKLHDHMLKQAKELKLQAEEYRKAAENIK
jgi:hypothetical protein